MTRHIYLYSLTIAFLASSPALAQSSGQLFQDSQSTFNDVFEGSDQEEDEIETDRDSFTPASTLVGAQRMVFESAYTFIDNRSVPETHSLPELVVRYGLTELLELRFGTNYEIGGAGNPVSANIPDDLENEAKLEQETNVSYGLKLALTDQAGWKPTSAMLVQAFTPVNGENTDTHFVATYVTGWILRNKWACDSAIRYSTGSAQEDRFNVWAPSTVLKIPMGERWKAHIEYFGVFSDGRARESTQHFISPGVHYLINRNWEIGTRFGWGLNEQAPNFFTNIGGGYRF